INSGPLMGTAFNNQGQPYAFQYGTGYQGVNIQTGLGGTVQGVPAKNGNAASPGTVTNCTNFGVGGETDGGTGSGVTLATPLTRGDVYTRTSYELTPNTEVFMTMGWA